MFLYNADYQFYAFHLFIFFALTELYMFMLQYLALNEQALCFFIVSSFVLSDVQIFLQISGTVFLSAPSYCQLLS